MRKRTYLIICSCLFLIQAAFAKPVSIKQAMQAAKNFLAEKKHFPSNTLKLAHQENLTTESNDIHQTRYYVFTQEGSEGFVIISGDDQSELVLGYSDEGVFSIDDMPENMRYWLDGCVEAPINTPSEGNAYSMPRKPSPASTVSSQAIAPLIETSWNQIAPYNLKCFMGNKVQSYAGCVATAISQVMYYHKWPEASIPAIPGYIADNGYKYAELPPLPPFEWNIMKKAYILPPSGNEIDKSLDAITDLMLYSGHAVKMIYREGSAGAHTYDILPAMFNYFGYCNKARLLRREDFSNTSWALMIDEELCNHRPVLYFGSSSGGSAHAFIIDGCDGKGMYHINWGAGGKSNGYFRLNTLRPSVLNENHSAFDNSQAAIFGLSPHYTKTAASTHLATHKFTANTTTAILEGRMLNLDISHDFSCLVNIAYVDEAIGLYKDGRLISFQAIDKQVYALRDSLIRHEHNCQIPMPSGDGEYEIKALNRESGDEEWDEDQNANQHTISISLNNGKVTLKNNGTQSDVTQKANIQVDGVSQDFSYGLKPIKLQVKVRNTGNANFNGTMHLAFNSAWEYYCQCAIDAGQEGIVNFFVNKPIGTYSIHIFVEDDYFEKMFSMGRITLTNKSPLPELEYCGISFNNVSESTLYGRMFDGAITLRNPSATDYNCTISYDVVHGDNIFVSQITEDVEIKAGETKDIPIQFDNIEFGEQIRIENVQDGYHTYYNTSETYTVKPGMVLWKANGERNATAPTLLMRVPEDAVAASFEGLGTIRLSPNSNPNTIYYFDHNSYPPYSLTGKNVVLGDSADKFTLVEGKDFYVPYTFHAKNATFNYSPEVGFDGINGWLPIVLPFSVEEVLDNSPSYERNLSWGAIHSPYLDGKDFWLKEISNITEDKVYLENVRLWQPNKPYLMSFPDRNWGQQYQLLQHPLSFCGHDVQVVKTPVCKVVMGNHEIIGVTGSQTLPQAYRLNPEGNGFVWTSSSETKPYDVWLSYKDDNAPEKLSIYNEGIIKGDANGDGIINISDVMTIVNYIINFANSVFIWGNADTDGNGIINVKDLMDTVILNLNQ